MAIESADTLDESSEDGRLSLRSAPANVAASGSNNGNGLSGRNKSGITDSFRIHHRRQSALPQGVLPSKGGLSGIRDNWKQDYAIRKWLSHIPQKARVIIILLFFRSFRGWSESWRAWTDTIERDESSRLFHKFAFFCHANRNEKEWAPSDHSRVKITRNLPFSFPSDTDMFHYSHYWD